MSPRRYEMRRRALSYQETRRRIMDATFDMHRAKGVAATTFSDVAAGAGVSAATVLRHFPTMGDLVAACGVHVWEWLEVPEPDGIFHGVEGVRARARRLVEEICGIYERGEAPLAGARRDRTAVPQLDGFLRRLDADLEGLVRAALAPQHPDDRTVRLTLALLDFGVWQSLRERGLDERSELTAVLRCVLRSGG